MKDENKNRWYGPEFCPHPGEECIDGCAYCGRKLPIDDHNHTPFKGTEAQGGGVRYNCVCETC